MRKKIDVIIDCDTGIDDAFALMLAMNTSWINIKLITTVMGNVNVDKATENTLHIVEYAKANIPVAKGANMPLVKDSIAQDFAQGESGLGNLVFDTPKIQAIYTPAVEAMYETINSNKNKVIIIALGAMTNIANLITTHPDVIQNIDYIFMMAGSMNGEGNIKEYAEFNSFEDPDALDIVLNSNVNIVISPIEVGWSTAVKKEVFKSNINKPNGKMINDMIEGSFDHKVGYYSIHDPMLIVGLMNPKLFEFAKCDIQYNKSNGQMFITKNPKGKYIVQIVKDEVKAQKYFLEKLYQKIN